MELRILFASCAVAATHPAEHVRSGFGLNIVIMRALELKAVNAAFQLVCLPLTGSVVIAEPAPGFQPPKTTAFWLHQGEQSCSLPPAACTLLNPILHVMWQQTWSSLRSCQTSTFMCTMYQCGKSFCAQAKACLV